MDERVVLVGRVLDRQGSPIAGATVLAAPARRDSWRLKPMERARASASSDASGAFRLLVERGELHVQLRSPGHVALDLVRTAASATRAIDLGAVTLERAATLPGRVVDAAGEPVAGARVLRIGTTDLVDRERLEWGAFELARSDADGRFLLPGLSLGRMELELCAPGHVRVKHSVFVEAYDPPEWLVQLERGAPITGRVLGAPAGVELEVSFWLQEEAEQRSVPCDARGSFVIDDLAVDHEPVRLYAVQRAPGGASSPAFAGPSTLSRALSVRPGTAGVELVVPPPATYRVRVVDSIARAPLVEAHVGLLESLPWESERPCRVSSDAPGDYVLAVVLAEESKACALVVVSTGYERVVLGGRAFVPGETHDFGLLALEPLPTTRVRVLDEREGTPLPGASLHARLEQSEDCFYASVRAEWPARGPLPAGWEGTSAEDGAAEARLSCEQRYGISVEREGYAPSFVSLDTSPRPPAELELRLLRGSAVSVICLDGSTRAPRPDEPIACERSEGGWGARAELRTAADGRVRFEHLAPGTYRFWPANHDPELCASVLEVANEAELELELAPRPEARVRIQGLVTEGGRPLAGALVEVWYTETSTDAEGRYELSGLDPGGTELIVTHPRFGLVHQQGVSLFPPDARVDVALELAPIEGVVHDDEGAPVAGIALSLGHRFANGDVDALWTGGRTPRAMHAATSGADGRFRFAGVQPREDLWLILERDGFRTQRVGPLSFPRDGSTLTLEPRMSRAETLEVEVEGLGESLALEQVHAVWLGDPGFPPADCDQRGDVVPAEPGCAARHYRFERLFPGRWAIELRAFLSLDGAPLAREEVTLPRKGSEPVVLKR